MKLISPDAMFLGSSMFSLMEPGHGKLTFKMIDSRPTARTQAALDELVEAKLISSEPFNDFGGITYTPLTKFKRPSASMEKRAGKWPITEPIQLSAAGRQALATSNGGER